MQLCAQAQAHTHLRTHIHIAELRHKQIYAYLEVILIIKNTLKIQLFYAEETTPNLKLIARHKRIAMPQTTFETICKYTYIYTLIYIYIL